MSTVKERYTPIPVAANSTTTVLSSQLGGFLVKTAGTITVIADGVTLIDTFPVDAGFYLPLPFYVGGNGCTFITAGGASGTIAV